MVKRRKIIHMIVALIMTLATAGVLINRSVINIGQVVEAGNDFQYNVITFSVTLAGFLFTGISILISTLGNERINRLWKHHYLDDLSMCSTIGMFSSIISIIVALILTWCSPIDKIRRGLISLEISSVIVTVVFFIWCAWRLAVVIRKLKE